MRVALAKALFAQPDVLLLDEPTNHLDWAAILWLERYLQGPEMEAVALVVVSHDRTFLDNVCTMILRVHDKKLHLHSGIFSTFESAHEEDQQHRAELAAKVAEKRGRGEASAEHGTEGPQDEQREPVEASGIEEKQNGTQRPSKHCVQQGRFGTCGWAQVEGFLRWQRGRRGSNDDRGEGC